jgi:hypothetical protein
MVIPLFVPTCPQIVTSSSIMQQPAMPVWLAIRHFLPMIVSCPTCIWLSNFEPSPIVVSPVTPLSIVQLAPISTLSSMTTLPQEINLSNPSGLFF